ncbi:MAG: hypothetical protein H0V17_25050, partial [Deltaproteobacteria bacterium]|nr:hypothetical protein [Deltaproteobacteria bacterium]
MDSVRAQVAVLSISGTSAVGVAMETVVADSLTAAGHQLTAFESVKNSETAIRSQLVGWIEDPDIDLVIVIGEGATSKAMAPLVDQPLPGFADLLRMLAFQEIGASAMLSNAEAAKCGTTFVFVLPMGEKAVRAAMEKLILPQLDPRTQPKNLISEMPRFREVGDFTRVDTPSEQPSPLDSIPRPIENEKTAAGAGLMPRVPARNPSPNDGRTLVDKAPEAPAARSKSPTQSRVKSATGKNVIVRTVEDPTKPIELQKLERQIELSKASGDRTKPLNLSKLPSLPPGADQKTIEREVGEQTLAASVKPVTKHVSARGPAPLTTKQSMPLKAPAHVTPPMPNPIVQPAQIAATAKPAAEGKPVITKRPALLVVDEPEALEPAPARPRPKT